MINLRPVVIFTISGEKITLCLRVIFADRSPTINTPKTEVLHGVKPLGTAEGFIQDISQSIGIYRLYFTNFSLNNPLSKTAFII